MMRISCTINIIFISIVLNLDTMIILLLLLAMLHTGLAAITGYEEVEKNLLTKLGKIYAIHKYIYYYNN